MSYYLYYKTNGLSISTIGGICTVLHEVKSGPYDSKDAVKNAAKYLIEEEEVAATSIKIVREQSKVFVMHTAAEQMSAGNSSNTSTVLGYIIQHKDSKGDRHFRFPDEMENTQTVFFLSRRRRDYEIIPVTGRLDGLPGTM